MRFCENSATTRSLFRLPSRSRIAGSRNRRSIAATKAAIVVARNDELLIFLGYHGFDIPDINGSNRKAGRHRFKQCYRHLLRIGGQGKNVKPTQHGFRRYMSGKDNTVLYIELMHQLLQPNSFDARAGDHEPHR